MKESSLEHQALGEEPLRCRHAARPEQLALAPGQLDAAALICQALADPARLRLLLWLAARGELCVSELVELEQQRLGTVSARLQQLHGARLVTRRREARHVLYALADEHVRALLENIVSHAGEATPAAHHHPGTPPAKASP